MDKRPSSSHIEPGSSASMPSGRGWVMVPRLTAMEPSHDFSLPPPQATRTIIASSAREKEESNRRRSRRTTARAVQGGWSTVREGRCVARTGPRLARCFRWDGSVRNPPFRRRFAPRTLPLRAAQPTFGLRGQAQLRDNDLAMLADVLSGHRRLNGFEKECSFPTAGTRCGIIDKSRLAVPCRIEDSSHRRAESDGEKATASVEMGRMRGAGADGKGFEI